MGPSQYQALVYATIELPSLELTDSREEVLGIGHESAVSVTVLERRLPMGMCRELGLGGRGGFAISRYCSFVGAVTSTMELYRRKGS